MKSATRHMLLLAGMLCLWASAYSLGRDAAHERTGHRGQVMPAVPSQAVSHPGQRGAGITETSFPRLAGAASAQIAAGIATPMLAPGAEATPRLAVRHPPRP